MWQPHKVYPNFKHFFPEISVPFYLSILLLEFSFEWFAFRKFDSTVLVYSTLLFSYNIYTFPAHFWTNTSCSEISRIFGWMQKHPCTGRVGGATEREKINLLASRSKKGLCTVTGDYHFPPHEHSPWTFEVTDIVSKRPIWRRRTIRQIIIPYWYFHIIYQVVILQQQLFM